MLFTSHDLVRILTELVSVCIASGPTDTIILAAFSTFYLSDQGVMVADGSLNYTFNTRDMRSYGKNWALDRDRRGLVVLLEQRHKQW